MRRSSQNSYPLEGCNLIDASAGSGKTYGITSIFLDLIVEKGLDISEILVVTFTEAATNELEDRIRRRLREGCDREGGERKAALGKALLSMDEASIFTIHGFCMKILTEHAFESNACYGSEMSADIDDLMKQAYYDYLRTHFIHGDINQLKLIKSGKMSPFNYEDVYGAVKEKLSNPDIEVLPDIQGMTDFKELCTRAAEMCGAYENLRAAWGSRAEEIKQMLKDASLHQGKGRYNSADIEKFCADMDAFFGGTDPVTILKSFENSPYFERFTSDSISRARTKSTSAGIENEVFFSMCQRLLNMKDEISRQITNDGLRHFTALFDWFSRKLEKAKKQRSILTFDDLIITLRDALRSAAGSSLVSAVTKRFRAVLIDEFQDTDPIQYEIFNTLFFSNKEIVSYMIGDPKQSIYAFRGADVFSYINARKGAENGRITCAPPLTNNYRSDEGLISAVNTLFGRKRSSFLIPGIDYEESHFPPRSAKKFSISRQGWKPMEIVCIDSSKDDDIYKGLLRRERAKHYAAEFLVREIGALLSSAVIDGRNIKQSDVAVLVRTKREAGLIKRRLAAARIPAVYYSAESIFETDECGDLIVFMRAVQEPKNSNLVRQALLTSFFGLSYREIFEIEKDPENLESHMEKLFRYRDAWHRKSFIAMMHAFIAEENVKVRILSGSDGERRMANLSQLLELCQKEAFRRKLDPPGLLTWCGEERAAALSPERKSTPAREHLLRLESDDYAVRILTIHKSKGLEFPIVFIPFCWDEPRLSGKNHVKIHKLNEEEYRLMLCLGKEEVEKYQNQAAREELAENMRLIYVAVTRAMHKCYMFWGAINGAARSAYTLLFHYGGDLADADICSKLKAPKAGEIAVALEALKGADDNIGIRFHDDNQDLPAAIPSCRALDVKLEALPQPPSKAIEKNFRISSFTGLISGAEQESCTGDYDGASGPDDASGPDGVPRSGSAAEPDGTGEQQAAAAIFDFPGGSKAGSMFHGIMESLDFQESDEEKIKKLVEEKLANFGYEPSPWIEPIRSMLGNVVKAELAKDGNPFTLSQISLHDRLSELNFIFPVTTLAREDFQETLAALPIPDVQKKLGGLCFSPFKGYITGSIDCVARHDGRYYLFDWKSNLLGRTPSDYTQEKLEEEIGSSYYFLQYSLYTLALDQYLALRLGGGYRYDTHFGGIYYLFMRGMDSEKDRGIYFSKLPPDLVKTFKDRYIIKKAGLS